jgi:hypothetical protein
MPYVFPKRKLADGDILDPIDMNEDFIPVVELYSGKLNEHNFKETGSAGLPTLTDAGIETNAYYSFIDEKKVVNPHFGSTAPFNVPQLTDITFKDKLKNDVGWAAIPLNGSGDTSVTTTTENTALWLEALIQYSISPQTFSAASYVSLTTRFGFTGQYRLGIGDSTGARVQFAIRVDGAVLPSTITGHLDVFHASSRGEKPSVAYQISSADELIANAPGPKIEQEADLGALGNFCYPVRLGALLELTAGSHVVELVARRVPRVDQTIAFDPDDVVSVYTRRLFAVQIPQFPRSSTTFASIEVEPFDSESPVSQATLAASIDATRDKFNAVESGALARGALRAVQLPPAVLASNTGEQATSGTSALNSVFPGWANVGNAYYGVTPGWTPSAISGSVTTPAFAAGQTAKILLMAEAHVQDLFRLLSDGDDRDVLGALAIAVSTDGGSTYEIQQDSIVWFNNTNGQRYPFNALPGPVVAGKAHARANMNIATMTVLSATAGAATWNYVVVGCVIPTGVYAGAAIINNMTTVRGTISAMVLRN